MIRMKAIGPIVLSTLLSSVGLSTGGKATWYLRDFEHNKCHGSEAAFLRGPFRITAFCEDALGVYVAITYSGRMGAPKVDVWRIDQRNWQESGWGADVTSFAWAPSGEWLYVATSSAYGAGGLFLLNLRMKEATRLEVGPHSGRETEASLVIVGISAEGRKLKVLRRAGSEQEEFTVGIGREVK